jgi:hypothetical protein
MSQTLTSDMVRKSLDVFLERLEEVDEFTPDDARGLLDSCEMAVLLQDKLWQMAEALLDRGMESKKLASLLKGFTDVIEIGLKAFATAGERLKSAVLTPEESTKAVSLLEQATRRATERRDRLLRLLQWLATPPREVSARSLPENRGDQKATGYLSLDEVTNQLLSGGHE